MAARKLSTPYELTEEELGRRIKDRRPGAYALGYMDIRGHFVMKHVGRSDEDIRMELRGCVGRFPFFQFAYCATTAVAFVLECELYHMCVGCENLVHPTVPDDLKVLCPICGFSSSVRQSGR